MSWNYRLMAHENKSGVMIAIHQVFYNNNEPASYSPEPSMVMGDVHKDGVTWVLANMLLALNKPILYYGDKFPQEYK